MLEEIFNEAFARFLTEERALILNGTSERALCCRLAMKLEDSIKKMEMNGYYADAEYNRNHGEVKRIRRRGGECIEITTDVIVHSRGENLNQDNLIAIEMKKSTLSSADKQRDRERLEVLTGADDQILGIGKTNPKHVSGYKLGVFIDLNLRAKSAIVEFYGKGALRNSLNRSF